IRSEDRRRYDGAITRDATTPDFSRYRAQRASEDVVIGANEPRPTRVDTRALLWRWRIAIIGVLIVALGTYAISAVLRGGTADDRPQVVGVSQHFSSGRWDYLVIGTQRAQAAGRAVPRGVYYVVRVTATNRGSDGARLLPSDFTLIDANGV